MDIVFGECVDLGGHRYALLLADVATRYCRLYGMSYLSSTSITSALENFKSEAGQLPKRFHSDFEKKNRGRKCAALYPCQRIKHYRSSMQMSILEWISIISFRAS